MRRDLEAFGQGREVTATIKGVPAVAEDSTQVIRSVSLLERQATRRPGGLVALALALLIGGLALGTWSLVALFSTVVGRVDVPRITAKQPETANRILLAAGLQPSFQTQEFSDTVAAGLVTRQDPPAGRSIAKGSQVKYWVSNGKEIVTVPNVVGMSINDAANALDQAGLTVGNRIGQFSDKDPGTVLGQNPDANRQARKGDSVDLTVSQGQQKAIVPDVIGQAEADAAATLANAGFRVNRIREAHPGVDKGVVFDQDPKANTQAPSGSVVNIFISQGTDQLTMPDERGKTASDAKADLESMGLNVQEVSQFTFDSSQYGTVVDQNPAPGSGVNQGDTVTIYVGSSS
jgi:serine/threonine-protein kinase